MLISQCRYDYTHMHCGASCFINTILTTHVSLLNDVPHETHICYNFIYKLSAKIPMQVCGKENDFN